MNIIEQEKDYGFDKSLTENVKEIAFKQTMDDIYLNQNLEKLNEVFDLNKGLGQELVDFQELFEEKNVFFLKDILSETYKNNIYAGDILLEDEQIEFLNEDVFDIITKAIHDSMKGIATAADAVKKWGGWSSIKDWLKTQYDSAQDFFDTTSKAFMVDLKSQLKRYGANVNPSTFDKIKTELAKRLTGAQTYVRTAISKMDPGAIKTALGSYGNFIDQKIIGSLYELGLDYQTASIIGSIGYFAIPATGLALIFKGAKKLFTKFVTWARGKKFKKWLRADDIEGLKKEYESSGRTKKQNKALISTIVNYYKMPIIKDSKSYDVVSKVMGKDVANAFDKVLTKIKIKLQNSMSSASSKQNKKALKKMYKLIDRK